MSDVVLRKEICLGIFFSFCLFTEFAFSKDLNLVRNLLRPSNVSLQYTNLENSYNTIQFSSGLPPIFWGQDKKNFLSMNFSFSSLEFSPDNYNETFDFTKLSITPVYRLKINKDWSFSTIFPVSFAYQEGKDFLNNQALAFVGVMNFTKNLSESGSNYSVGLVAIKQALRTLVVPNFSYQYIDKDFDWVFRFGFPKISLDKVYEHWVIGTFLSLNFDSFLLNPESNLYISPEAKYFNSEKIFAGLKLNFKLREHFYLENEFGWIVTERLFISDENRDAFADSRLSRPGIESYFLNVNLGYKF